MTDRELKEGPLVSWTALNAQLEQLSEKDLIKALELELKGEKREGVIMRLANRVCRLKRARALEKVETLRHVEVVGAKAVMAAFDLKEIAVIDFESEPIEPGSYPPKPVGVAINAPDAAPKYWAWGHPVDNNCSKREAAVRLREVCRRFAIVCHNAAFDLHELVEHMCVPLPEEYHCTLILAFLDDPYAMDLRLKSYYEKRYGVAPKERDKLYEWIKENVPDAAKKKELGEFICKAPGSVVAPYAIGDTTRPKRMFKDLSRTVERAGMWGAYQRELAQLPLIFDMTRTGVPIDRPRLERDIGRWSPVLEDLDEWMRARLKAPDLEIGKAAQVIKALDAANLMDDALWTLTPGGEPSTAFDVIKEACKDQQFVDVWERRGMLATSLHTFMQPWLEFSERDGHLHIIWNTTRRPGRDERKSAGARTGRWSSSPNLQNVPTTKKQARAALKIRLRRASSSELLAQGLPNVRSYMVPGKGRVWIKRDFSQQEFRIAGHYEGKALQQAYRDNPRMDIHIMGRDGVNAVLHSNYDRDITIKPLGFGILYGQGQALTADKMSTDIATAKRIKQVYLDIFPGLKDLQDGLKALARAGQPLRTWGGRLYYCEPAKILTKGKWKGKHMSFEYKMLNTEIQGSAADCTKEAGIRTHRALGPGHIMLQVHDEFDALSDPGSYKRDMALMREAMESVGWDADDALRAEREAYGGKIFDVPMLTDGSWSRRSWGELEDYKDA